MRKILSTVATVALVAGGLTAFTAQSASAHRAPAVTVPNAACTTTGWRDDTPGFRYDVVDTRRVLDRVGRPAVKQLVHAEYQYQLQAWVRVSAGHRFHSRASAIRRGHGSYDMAHVWANVGSPLAYSRDTRSTRVFLTDLVKFRYVLLDTRVIIDRVGRPAVKQRVHIEHKWETCKQYVSWSAARMNSQPEIDTVAWNDTFKGFGILRANSCRQVIVRTLLSGSRSDLNGILADRRLSMGEGRGRLVSAISFSWGGLCVALPPAPVWSDECGAGNAHFLFTNTAGYTYTERVFHGVHFITVSANAGYRIPSSVTTSWGAWTGIPGQDVFEETNIHSCHTYEHTDA